MLQKKAGYATLVNIATGSIVEKNSIVAEGNAAKDVEEHGCVNYSPILQNSTSFPAQLASGCGESELECQVIFKTGKQMETSSLHFPAI